MTNALLVLQGFQVAFLLLHDWVPLGRLTNLKAVAQADPLRTRVLATLVSSVFFAIGFTFSIVHAQDSRFPEWLRIYLLVSYGLLFLGEMRAWWVPYLLWNEPVRAARYRERFAGTYKFLPERNGIAPDALHVALHIVTLATLILLAFA